jgi:hypothetical protein
MYAPIRPVCRCSSGTLRRICRYAALVFVCMSVHGCDLANCTTDFRAAISVTVIDSTTLGAISDPSSIRVIAVDRTYSDTVTYDNVVLSPQGPFDLAHERPGHYTVTVTAAEYHPWTAAVRVSENRCHVNTQTLLARLRSLQ